MTPQELSAKTEEVIGTSGWFHVPASYVAWFDMHPVTALFAASIPRGASSMTTQFSGDDWSCCAAYRKMSGLGLER